MVNVRWMGERVVHTLRVPVYTSLELREVVLSAPGVYSPGGSKHMKRCYRYMSSPDVAAAFGDEYAEKVSCLRKQVQRVILDEFSEAEKNQVKIRNRSRDEKRREFNKETYGTARAPKNAKQLTVARTCYIAIAARRSLLRSALLALPARLVLWLSRSLHASPHTPALW